MKFIDEKNKQLLVTARMSDIFNAYSLGERIVYFIKNEQTAIKQPLKNFNQIKIRYPDKIQILAFAYASLFKNLLGNFTFNKAKVLETHEIYGLTRTFNPKISENPFENHIRIEFKFGQLHIVSCGSRGLEPNSFFQIMTVFDTQIWILLVVFTVLVIFCSKHFIGISFKASMLSILKVLLEQGGPFPENKETVNKLKFLFCGTLLAGLVISNAFKSENVYNIVTPRKIISYRTLQELVEDNFKIFSRITHFNYFDIPGTIWRDQNLNQHCFSVFHSSGYGFGETEALPPFKILGPWQEKLNNQSQINPDTLKIFLEPKDLMESVVNCEVIKTFDLNIKEKTFKERFWNNQNKLISQDLHNCNKSGWILPNYLAQQISRSLIKTGKHSDVGTVAYTSPFLYLEINGIFPLSLLNQFSYISTSGLVERWPNFINRTDLSRDTDKTRPTKPNMKGHTQVIFILLGTGLLTAFIGWVGEMSGIVFKCAKSLCALCRLVVWSCKSRLTIKRKIRFRYALRTSVHRKRRH